MSQSWSSLETFKQCVCTCGALFILPTYSQIYLEFMPSMLDCMWKERERVTMLLLSNEIYTKRFSFVLIVVLVSLPLPIITFNKSWELNHSTVFLYTTGLCKKKEKESLRTIRIRKMSQCNIFIASLMGLWNLTQKCENEKKVIEKAVSIIMKFMN